MQAVSLKVCIPFYKSVFGDRVREAIGYCRLSFASPLSGCIQSPLTYSVSDTQLREKVRICFVFSASVKCTSILAEKGRNIKG